MELSQEQIIQKPNKQELFSLFMTHRLNVMHAPVKFHKYFPYGLGVMARTRIGTYVRTYVRDGQGSLKRRGHKKFSHRLIMGEMLSQAQQFYFLLKFYQTS